MPYRLDNARMDAATGDIILAKRGVYVYYDDETGRTTREAKLDENLNDPESLKSLEALPITDGHPEVMVNLDTGDLMKGAISSPRYDRKDGQLHARHRILDRTLLNKIQNGKREVSLGYDLVLEHRPGIFEGQHYDYVQTKIRYNHAAIVDRARCGPTVKINLDGQDRTFIGTTEGNTMPKTLTFRTSSNQDVQVDEAAHKLLMAEKAVADQLRKDHDDLKKRMDQHDAEKAEEKKKADEQAAKDKTNADHSQDAQKRIDALQAQVEALKKASEQIRMDAVQEAMETLQLHENARKIVPHFDAAGKSANDIKALVIKEVFKSDPPKEQVHLDAQYLAALHVRQRDAANGPKTPGPVQPNERVRKAYEERAAMFGQK